MAVSAFPLGAVYRPASRSLEREQWSLVVCRGDTNETSARGSGFGIILGGDRVAVYAAEPPGFAEVKGHGADTASGLPKQIVHLATCVRSVLVPAGEFLMGSPDDHPDRSRWRYKSWNRAPEVKDDTDKCPP